MRDIILTLFVFGSLPFILRNAYMGVLVWSWLSYMNPHRLTWGFAYSMPFAQIVAVTLFIALLIGKEKNKFPMNGLTVVWVVFLFWMAVSTIFALQGDVAFEQLIKIYKIQAIILLTLLLFNDPKRLPMLIWVIVLSIGFFSVKGGIFTIQTGGSYRVWGPATSYISENNALAVATLMIIPLMIYLYRISEKRWVQYLLAFSMVMSLASVVGSQSRGALLAIIAVSGFFWLKTKGKIISGALIIAFAWLGWNFMPESWHDRMGTIENYEQDASAMGRINAWHYSFNVANGRLTGAGLESWSKETFAVYAPNPNAVAAAHSIFFAVLADHGWPGLIMYLLILALSWRYLSQVIKFTTGKDEYTSQNTLARMLQVSMVAYMSGGAFLSLAYFDLPWHLIAISVLLKTMVLEPDEKPS
jgi:probable O-glycosylation ligase (exosortase A-associated)